MGSPTPLPAPRALLLDLDGTLAETLPDIAASVNHTRVQLGFTPMPEPAVRAHVGDGALRLLMECTGFPEAEVRETLLPRWQAHYTEHCTDGTHLLPGAEALLDAAAERNIPCALVTNKPRRMTERIAAALGLTPHLGAMVCGDDLPTRKPDPAMVHAALEALGGIAPDGAWLVGDGSQDIGAAAAAGCGAVFVPGYGHPGRARAAGPHVECADLAAVTALLRSA